MLHQQGWQSTALIQAAGLGYTSVVTWLLRAGAKIDAVDEV